MELPIWQQSNVQLLEVSPDPEFTTSWTVGIATGILQFEDHNPVCQKPVHRTRKSKESVIFEHQNDPIDENPAPNSREQATLFATAFVVVAFALISFWSSR